MLLRLKTPHLKPVCHFKQIRMESLATSFDYNITEGCHVAWLLYSTIKALESKAVGSSGLSVSLGAVKYIDWKTDGVQ